MRRVTAFDCAGETLLGSLDKAAGTTGLLIVSGGNEIRSGAHRGMASLAARLAARGTPVFRYDRRGVGDSGGINAGYAGARDDLIAAAAAFRTHAPHVTRLVGFGNCDAATTLALFGHDAGIDGLILANPWVVETADDLPPPAAIRARYAGKLRQPSELLRLARGGVSVGRLIEGLRRIAMPRGSDDLATRAFAALTGWADNATVILAHGDATAMAYADAARRARINPKTTTIETASHSFARAADAVALEDAIRTALARYSAAS